MREGKPSLIPNSVFKIVILYHIKKFLQLFYISSGSFSNNFFSRCAVAAASQRLRCALSNGISKYFVSTSSVNLLGSSPLNLSFANNCRESSRVSSFLLSNRYPDGLAKYLKNRNRIRDCEQP